MEHGLVAPNARIIFMGGENAHGVKGMNENPIFTSPKTFRNFISGTEKQDKYNPIYNMGVSKLTSDLLAQKLSQQNDEMSIYTISHLK